MNKKIALIIICALTISVSVFAQPQNFKIIYRHCIQIDTAKVLKDTIGSEAILIGNNKATNYSLHKLIKSKQKDTLLTENELLNRVFADPLKMVPKTEDGKMTGQFKVKPNKAIDSIGDIVYYDKEKDTIYTREKMIEEYVVFTEKMPQINWNITDETRLIKNYKCYKATTYFRGRDYTAWFTTDVPIIAAPWKLNGLPGLILDIYDNKNQVKIYAESIEYPSKDIVNNFYATGIKVTLQEYLEYRNFEFGKKIKNIQIMVDSQPGIENTTYKPKPVTRNILYGIEKSIN